MREKLEKSLPIALLNFIKRTIYKFRLLKYYFYDYKQYSKSSFGFKKKPTYENLRAKITLHYHSLEKGLSNLNIRLGFGERALKNLFHALEEYKMNKFPKDDERYLSAINALIYYVDFHEKSNYDVSWVKEKLDIHLKYLGNDSSQRLVENKIGHREFSKSNILETLNKPFDEFIQSRISIRDYSEEEVDINLINKAIELAILTPSVCNRQPWKVYVLKDYELIQKVLNLQNGVNGVSRKNTENLLVVTSDISYFANDKERNEPFIDGGLFSMTLLYALHYQGLAACCLNASMSSTSFEAVKKMANIKNSERLIMFISVGNYSENIKVPVSQRDGLSNFVEYR